MTTFDNVLIWLFAFFLIVLVGAVLGIIYIVTNR